MLCRSLAVSIGVLVATPACIISDDVGDDGTSAATVGDGDTSGDGDGDSESSGESSETGTEGEPCEPAEVTEVAGCPEILGEGFCPESVAHVPTDTVIEWLNNPPHSGKHFPIWETKGEHDTPVERGYWVHNLEHGWIVLAYNCPDGCELELDQLRAVLAARPDISILMTEDPLLDGPRFAAISWTWVYEFDTPLFDLLCFIDQHFDHAPESVPG